MRRKQLEHEQALLLRKKGKSIKQIAQLLGVSISTSSLWCRDVSLSPRKREALRRITVRIRHLRMLAKKSHLEKISRVKSLFDTANNEIELLTANELFLVGVGLYWAEGFKSIKEVRLGFCNSDPRMIKFIIKWFKRSLKVKNEDFVLRAEFNNSHADREAEIKKYWVRLTGIPQEQFNKSLHHRSVWQREYKNRENYFGVLRIRVRRSGALLSKMRGWINGLSSAA